jgi:hypothetical protein
MARPWCETHLISCTKEYTFRGQGTDNILLGPKDVLPWVFGNLYCCQMVWTMFIQTHPMGGVCSPTRRQEVTRKQQKAKIVMREREREVKLKTKHLICNMKIFEIRFWVTRVLHVCPSL